MKTYIVLLRGINVGGKNKMPMAELRQALEKQGFKNVQTYIQSGNIIIESEQTAAEIEKIVHTVIVDTFGFDISVLVKSQIEWEKIIEDNPFSQKSDTENYPKYLNVTLLKSPLPTELEEKLSQAKSSQEEYKITPSHVYLWYGEGQACSKLAETISKYPDGTSRNWNTMLKLKDLASACVS